MIKITIKYNNPIGNFKAIERTETITAEKIFDASGTNLLYYRNGYNTGSVSKSEIIDITGINPHFPEYEIIKAELKKRRENIRYFTKEFYTTFKECYIAGLKARYMDTYKKYLYKNENENFFRYTYYNPVYESDFYKKNSCAYCEFLTLATA